MTPVKPSFVIPNGTFRRTQRYVAIILWTLHLEGGKVESRVGHGIAALRAAAKRHDMPIDDIKGPSLTVALQDLDGGRFGKAIHRESQGSAQKLYGIELLIPEAELPPDPRPPRLLNPPPREEASPMGETVDVGPVVVHEPVDDVPLITTEPLAPIPNTSPNGNRVPPEPMSYTPDEPLPSPVPMVRPAPPIDSLLHIQSLAAGALIALSQMAGYVEQTTDEARGKDVQAERLAEALEENQRLRTRVKLQEDTIVAKGKEITGLRKSMLQLQANLDAIRGSGQVNHEALRALREREQLMQERPRVKA